MFYYCFMPPFIQKHRSSAWVTGVKPDASKCKPSHACVTIAWSKPESMIPKSLWPNSYYVISYQIIAPADSSESYDRTKSVVAKLDETKAVISGKMPGWY